MASASGGSSPFSGAGSPSGSRGTAPFSPAGPTYDDTVTDRWIELDGLVNMRDLGGLPTRDGGHTASGRLIRSDNLQDLTDGRRAAPRRRARGHRHRRPAHRRRAALRGPRAAGGGRVADPPPPLAHRREARRRPGCRGRQGARGALEGRAEEARRSVLGRPLPRLPLGPARLGVGRPARRRRCRGGGCRALRRGEGPHRHGRGHGPRRRRRRPRGHRRRLRADGRADRADHRPADAAAGLRRGAGQTDASTSRCPGPSRSRRSSTAVHEGYGGAAGWLVAHGWSEDEVERLRRRLTEPASR